MFWSREPKCSQPITIGGFFCCPSAMRAPETAAHAAAARSKVRRVELEGDDPVRLAAALSFQSMEVGYFFGISLDDAAFVRSRDAAR